MFSPIETIVSVLSHRNVVLTALSIALVSKLVIASAIVRYLLTDRKYRTPLLLLISFLLGVACNDSEYIIATVIREFMGITGDLPLNTLLCRVNWMLYVTRLAALALFFEYLLTKRLRFSTFWKLYSLVSILIVGSFLYLSIGYYGIDSANPTTLSFELHLIGISHLCAFFLAIRLIYIILGALKSSHVPHIIKTQVRYLAWVIVPFQFLSVVGRGWFLIENKLPIIGLNPRALEVLIGILSTYALFYISKKIMNLRFLNIRKHITTQETFNFLHQFKDILEQLSYATALNELAHLTQTFFQTAFGIRLGRTDIYIHGASTSNSLKNDAIHHRVDTFLGKESSLTKELYTTKIFLRDDAHFTAFYEDDAAAKEVLAFLDALHADVFLPIYERSTMVAYCIVEQDARPHKLYTKKERDEMIVFTTYLSNVIAIVKQSNLEALHLQKKELLEELHLKHQEIRQYKEVLRSYMRTSQERHIGLIFYKNRRFSCANEAATTFAPFDLNTQVGHPLAKACKSIARRVIEYKTAQTQYSETHGKKILLSGLPSIDGSSCIILLYYPELSDTVQQQINQLKDPSKWDYALYLETTESGRLINQLIPGTSEALMQFKISLLSAALGKKAVLLTLAEDDLMPTVEVLQAISLRPALHTIKLTKKEHHEEIARTLFGINKLIHESESLLTKHDEQGIIFIQNIELMSQETQQTLAQYLKFGYFYPVKSDHKQFSSARIICSTTKELSTLVHEGTFSKELYEQLQLTTVTMPQLAEEDITSLAHAFSEQLIQNDTFRHLLSLQEKDTHQFITDEPLSIHELKERVHTLLKEKSSKHSITEVVEFDPAYQVTDPDIAKAVRLGRKALKDARLMAILWHKFKNQNKIAQLLGVNRSSVNRRCQQYNLHS